VAAHRLLGHPKIEVGLQVHPKLGRRDSGEWRALLDSNQWPSASEFAPPLSTTVSEWSQSSSNRTLTGGGRSHRSTVLPTNREDFATRLLPQESLLTVREVAEQLRVCTATVYRLCDQGRLRHVRVLHAIRVHPADIATFVRTTRDPRQ
jgi:excisionase family DNA binding protein